MSIAMGAWLAGASGLVVGWVWAHVRHRASSRVSVVVAAVLGALLAALAYGAFLAAGVVISFMLFSGSPDAGPALLCVVIGSAVFLLLTWVQSVLAPHTPLESPGRASGTRGFQDLLDRHPVGGAAKMWLSGVGLALLPAVYGVQCLWTRTGSLGTLIWRTTVHGGPAIALGLGWIGVGAFLHFHFFFGLHPRLRVHSRMGKLAALIVACAGHSIAGAWMVLALAMG